MKLQRRKFLELKYFTFWTRENGQRNKRKKVQERKVAKKIKKFVKLNYFCIEECCIESGVLSEEKKRKTFNFESVFKEREHKQIKKKGLSSSE